MGASPDGKPITPYKGSWAETIKKVAHPTRCLRPDFVQNPRCTYPACACLLRRTD